jgi:hypothetical protein
MLTLDVTAWIVDFASSAQVFHTRSHFNFQSIPYQTATLGDNNTVSVISRGNIGIDSANPSWISVVDKQPRLQ